ncbi:unnamed protein product [Musa textilis]
MFCTCEETVGPMIDDMDLTSIFSCLKIFCHLVRIDRCAFKQLIVCFRSSAGKMILMRTLDQTPEEVSMMAVARLFYFIIKS